MRRRRSVCVTFLHESYNPRTEFHRMGFTHVYLPMLLEHSESQICQLGNPESGQREHALEQRQDLGPEAYADFAMTWVAQGAAIIGGCCEVGPNHIAELSRRLRADRHRII